MGGEDAQLDLREANLQVLKVVAFGWSCVLAGLLLQVVPHRLQLCGQRQVSSSAVLQQ